MQKYLSKYVLSFLFLLTLVTSEFSAICENSKTNDSQLDLIIKRANKLVPLANNHDSVSILLNMAGKLAGYSNNSHQSINILILSGLNEYNSSDYEKAVDIYYQALHLADQTNDSLMIAKANHNLGMVYDEFEDFDEAISHYLKSLNISESVKDTEQIAKTYQNIAISYQNKKNLDKALEFTKKAEQLAIARKDTLMLIDVINNFGTIAYDQKKLDESMEYYLKALDLYLKTNDKQGETYEYNNLGLVYLDKKEYQKSLSYFEKSLYLANQLNMYEFTGNIYSNLTILYQELKDYKNAFVYYDKYNTVYDSLIGEKKNRMIRQIQAKYQLVKKSHELEELKIKNQSQLDVIARAKSNQFYLIGITFLIIILMIATGYLLFKEKRLAGELKLKTNELKELNTSKDKFFSIIAHDLKNPFNVLVSYTSILKTDLELFSSDELKKIIADLNQASENGFNLLQNLLVWTRSQTNRIRVFKTCFVLSEIFKQVNSLAEFNLNAKDQKLFEEFEPDKLVFADKEMIATVVRNLVFNAIKFSKRGSVITVKTTYNASFASVYVIDSGIGIPDENIEKLFLIDKNMGSEGTEGESGTGLGLVICHEFIEKNGGTIQVKSKLGEGSIFSFTLPLAPTQNS